MSLPNAKVFRPEKELKGFSKVFLKAGESREIHIPFDDKTFRYWNVLTNRWEIEGGSYQILIGACVSDIRLSGTLQVEGTTSEFPYRAEEMPSYYSGLVQQVGDGEFEKLLGYSIPNGKWAGLLTENDAICQMILCKKRPGKIHLPHSYQYEKEERRKRKAGFKYPVHLQHALPRNRKNDKRHGQHGHGPRYGGRGKRPHAARPWKDHQGFFANARANKAYEKMLADKQ